MSPRLILILAAVALILLLGGGLYWKARHDAAAKFKPQIEAAKVQDKVDVAATAAVDHFTDHVTIIHDKAERASDAVQAAPGADTPLPPAVRSAWADGLRDLAPAVADPSPAKP